MLSCSRCKELKDESRFYKRENRKRGYNYVCKSCEWKQRQPYRSKPVAREKNKIQCRKRQAFGAKTDCRQGLSIFGYNLLMAKCKGVCSICQKPDPNGIRLAVDHDHETGEIRGLLCNRCNIGLGYFKDSNIALVRASAYTE